MIDTVTGTAAPLPGKQDLLKEVVALNQTALNRMADYSFDNNVAAPNPRQIAESVAVDQVAPPSEFAQQMAAKATGVGMMLDVIG